MRKMMLAGLLVATMGLASGNVAAPMACDQGMMDCLAAGCGEKGLAMLGADMGGHFRMMIEMLGLNAEQQKAVETIHFAHQKEVIRKTADLDVAKIELREVMGREPVKVEDAEKKIRAIAALRADLEVMHLKAKETIKTKLTPEQLERMKRHQAAGHGMMEKCDMAMADCMMTDSKIKTDIKYDMMREMKHDMMREMMHDEAENPKPSGGEAAGKNAEMKADHSMHH